VRLTTNARPEPVDIVAGLESEISTRCAGQNAKARRQPFVDHVYNSDGNGENGCRPLTMVHLSEMLPEQKRLDGLMTNTEKTKGRVRTWHERNRDETMEGQGIHVQMRETANRQI
jgi:hypothetical protein